MFPVSSISQRSISPDLLSAAQGIEERSPGLYILAARPFRYPVQQQKVSVRIDRYRKMNLLEKFVLRASAEIFPVPSLGEVADALGLDPIFIESTFAELSNRENILSTNEGLQVTDEGKKALASEALSEEPIHEYWYYVQDTILNTAYFVRHPLDAMDEELEKLADLNSYVKQDLTLFPAFAMNAAEHQAQLQEAGLDAHDPDQGQFVTEMEPIAPPDLRWKQLAIFVQEDTLSEDEETRILCQAYSEDEFVPQVGTWLEKQLQEQDLSLRVLCGLTDDAIAQEKDEAQVDDDPEESLVEERLEEIRQQATNQLRLQVKGQMLEQETGTALHLRDVEIRPAFLGALQKAREQIIIYSPWINEQVVDSAFIRLLEERVHRGVRILIGYGIERDERREERPVPPALIRRLREIQTVEGTPGIIVERLGNSHAKEIVIDQRVHFSGSQNWLSYRGDRFPRGETVYRVTITTEVEKAYNYLAQRFTKRAEALWSGATDEEWSLALCILGYLGQEQQAMEWIQRDTRYQFIPLWLRLAHQTISAKQEERILPSLQALIMLCGTAVNLEDTLREEISTALQGILRRLAPLNRKTINVLINENLPELTHIVID